MPLRHVTAMTIAVNVSFQVFGVTLYIQRGKDASPLSVALASLVGRTPRTMAGRMTSIDREESACNTSSAYGMVTHWCGGISINIENSLPCAEYL